MRAFQLSFRLLVLGSLLFAGGAEIAHAGNAGDFQGKLRTAWQKYSEFIDMTFAYNGRTQITDEIDRVAGYREDLLTNIRLTQIEVDSYPRRRNNLQEEVAQGLLGLRRELTATDHWLAELRSKLKQMDEMALRQAEMNGQPAKPTDRRVLLRESQRLEKECIDAFGSLKLAAEATAKEAGSSSEQVVIDATNSLALSRGEQAQLVPRAPFIAAFKRFSASKRLSEPAKAKQKATAKRKSVR
jgi:hypothetical protein